jgi:2,3-bisphosphoglycerate-independent phosphoglycerate mutase
MIDYSAGHISTQESRQLIEAIEKQCGTNTVCLHPGISYRHLLVYQGNISDSLTTVPPHDHMDQDVTGFYDEYKKDEHLSNLMQQASQVLAAHPVNIEREKRKEKTANAIWLWGEGKKPAMPSLSELYNVNGGMISAVDLLMGLGVLSGLEVVKVEGATGYLDTNYAGKAQAAIDVLQKNDFVVVHVEAPDEAGHQGVTGDKVQAIEDFDTKIVAPIVEAMEAKGEDFRVVVTMDHYTPLHRRTHEDWPVPLFIYDSRKNNQGSGLLYSEKNVLDSVEQTGLKMDSGTKFFRYFMESE